MTRLVLGMASSSDVPSSSKTVFVKPTVPELPPAVEDKQKEKVNDDVPGTQQPHCGLSGHVWPQCSLLKAQMAKAKKEAPRQAHYGARPTAQHQTPWYQATYQVPWGQVSRHQYQAPWSHAPQHQWPQQRFVPSQLQRHLQEQTQAFDKASRAILQ
jgi:hypothetical protein